jgi:hypothetical protein
MSHSVLNKGLLIQVAVHLAPTRKVTGVWLSYFTNGSYFFRAAGMETATRWNMGGTGNISLEENGRLGLLGLRKGNG